MKIRVKIFPAAGLSDKTQEFDMELKEGNISEVLTSLQKRLNFNPDILETINFIHNGRLLVTREKVIFSDEDQLWLMPQISGG
jgi:molybdopterin converting factor small subunit